MKPLLKQWIILSVLLLLSTKASAENLITMRINDNYDNAMIAIKSKLSEYGYKVAHIQKCDGGLTQMGYITDEYKLIFFGKLKEVRSLSKKFPMIIPYLPLKIAVIKEQDSVVLVALNPTTLSMFFKEKELQTQFGRWENDLRAIFNEITETENERIALLEQEE